MDLHTLRHVLPFACEWCVYVAVLLAAGGVSFLVFVHDRDAGERARLARLPVVAAAVGGVATLATLPLQAFRIAGVPGALIDQQLLTGVLESNYGTSVLVRLVGIVLILLAVSRLDTGWRAVAVGLVGGAVATLSFVVAGHSGVGEPRTLVAVASGAHLLGSAAWFGGLVLLWVVLGRRPAGAAEAAQLTSRFSAWALAAVVLLVASGAALAWAHGGSLAGLASTAYGQVLGLKVSLFAALLLVAAYNRWRLVPAIRAGNVAAWGRLRRTVGMEVWGVGVLVGVTAALINLAPPVLDGRAWEVAPGTVEEEVGM